MLMRSVPGAVATGSLLGNPALGRIKTRSLPLPVLTSSSVFICGQFLTVSPTLRQVIIDHPPPILLSFGHRRIPAFLIAADLVGGVQTFKSEFARGNRL